MGRMEHCRRVDSRKRNWPRRRLRARRRRARRGATRTCRARYTNSNESGIPMRAAGRVRGKTAGRGDARGTRAADEAAPRAAGRRAQTIGGTAENDTGAGPSHWYENYNAKNSRAWMISIRPTARCPALTAEAAKRAAAVRAARRGGDGYDIGPFDGPEDLRCTSAASRAACPDR